MAMVNGLSFGILLALCLTVSNVRSGSLLPPHCAAVSCLRVDCPDAYTPPGECCAVCPSRGEKPGFCPSTKGRIGICVERCTSDYSCPGNQKCCSNGCGHSCQQPVRGGWPRPFPRPGGPDCSVIRCAQVFCPGQYTPPGQCCPICPGGEVRY